MCVCVCVCVCVREREPCVYVCVRMCVLVFAMNISAPDVDHPPPPHFSNRIYATNNYTYTHFL